MTVSVRLNDDDAALFRDYAALHGLTMSELIRRAVLERINDAYDMRCYDRAMAEYRAHPESSRSTRWRRSWGFLDVSCAFYSGGEKVPEEAR